MSLIRVKRFAITSKILRILMEHIQLKYSPDAKLQIESICSITFLSILEVIPKTKKFSTLSLIDGPNPTLSMYYLVHIEIAQQAYNPPATTDDRL